MPTLSLFLAVILGIAMTIAACEDRTHKPAAPAFVMPLPEDPENAFNEYAAVAASDARLVLPNKGDVLNDESWLPDRKTVAQLKALEPEITRLIAASRRPRLDRVPPGGDPARAERVTGADVGRVRFLLSIEARRRRAEGDHDGSAACIAALLRMAMQVRSREGGMEVTVQGATARLAVRESAAIDMAAIRPETRAELISAAKALQDEPMYMGADRDEDTDRTTSEMHAKIRDFLAKLDAPTPR